MSHEDSIQQLYTKHPYLTRIRQLESNWIVIGRESYDWRDEAGCLANMIAATRRKLLTAAAGDANCHDFTNDGWLRLLTVKPQ